MSVRLQKKLSEEEEKKVVAEESDRTGESGIGTGSGTTRYGTVAEWKEAMENPPEGVITSYSMYRAVCALVCSLSIFVCHTHACEL